MDVKQAVQIALDYYEQLFSEYNYSDVRLEEVEKQDDIWKVTLGYIDSKSDVLDLLGKRRLYKKFDVNTTTGDVTAVKIRKVE